MKKSILLFSLLIISVMAFCQTEKEIRQERTKYYCASMAISASSTYLAKNTKAPVLWGFGSSLVLNSAHQALINGRVKNWSLKNLNASLFGTVAGCVVVAIPLEFFYKKKKN
jgi:hypothetical protein